MTGPPTSPGPLVRLVTGREVAVGSVYAIGRNYAEHAREMEAPHDPVAFLKPAACLLPGGGAVPWPAGCREVHHEVELVLLLGAGSAPAERDAERALIAALAVGVDLTARDLQSAAKRAGGPWARSKGFPGAAPVSAFVPLGEVDADMHEIDLRLEVDGRIRQEATVSEMTLDPPSVVALLSRWFPLRAGDLVFTGTPAGVGPLAVGQRASAKSRVLGVSVDFHLAAPDFAVP